MKFKLNEKYGYRFRDRFIIHCLPEKGDLQTIPPTVLLENMFACIIDTGTCYYVIKNSSDKTIKELVTLKGNEWSIPITEFIKDIDRIKIVINNGLETESSQGFLWSSVGELFSIFATYHNNIVYIRCKDEEHLDKYFPEINRFDNKIAPYISKLSKINIDEIRNHFELGKGINIEKPEVNVIVNTLLKDTLKEIVDRL